jgi:hypothetical protein
MLHQASESGLAIGWSSEINWLLSRADRLPARRCRRHHNAVTSADRWPDDVAVPTFGPERFAPVTGSSAQMRGRTRRSSRGARDWGAVAELSH